MARKFEAGQQVMVLGYRDKRGYESWNGPYTVEGMYQKTGGGWNQKYTLTINRKDKVVSLEEYGPILAGAQARAAREKTAERERQKRIAGMITQLVELVQKSNDPELDAAKFIYDSRNSELYTAAYRVIDSRREKSA